ncbi:MAG: DNA-3-methyladenine glycosylase [Verrucomicrobia bacterium]|nr:DNA-3-methyladenine glycosylase [Verrucomicrobiota bacterium]
MLTPLPDQFFRPSASAVAPLLLGHWLIRMTEEGPCGGPIVEVEAYLADDPACHAFNGETPRNRTMWGPPGQAYVYLIYGYHFCVNAVCCPQGTAEAVLIRAIEPSVGETLLQRNRPARTRGDLTNGPAKLCAAMRIDRRLDGTNLCDARSPLFIGTNPDIRRFQETHGPVVATTRVGISKAAELPLRFYLAGSLFVSQRTRKRSGTET